MVAKFSGTKPTDLPITEPPNVTMQKTSRVELDILSQVWDEGVQHGYHRRVSTTSAFKTGKERGRAELAQQIAAIIDGCFADVDASTTPTLELIALNEIVQLLAVQG